MLQSLGTGQRTQGQSRIVTEAQRHTALDELTAVNGLVTGLVREPVQRAALRKALFPQGLGAYAAMGLDELPKEFEDFLTVLTTNKAAFGKMADTAVADAAAALAPYAALRKQQKEDKNATGTARTDFTTLRPLLTHSLTESLHLGALLYAPTYDLALAWFTAGYFNRHRVSNPAGTHHRTVAAGASHSLYDLGHAPGNAATTATVSLPAGPGGPLLVGRAATARLAPEAATAQPLLPGQTLVLNLALLGSGDWLVCHNDGTRQLDATVVLG